MLRRAFLTLLLALPAIAQEKKPEEVKWAEGKAVWEEGGLRYTMTVSPKNQFKKPAFYATFEMLNVTETTNIEAKRWTNRLALPKLTDDRGQSYIGGLPQTTAVALAPGKSAKATVQFNEPNPKAERLYFLIPATREYPAKLVTVPADLWKH